MPAKGGDDRQMFGAQFNERRIEHEGREASKIRSISTDRLSPAAVDGLAGGQSRTRGS